MCRLPGSVEGRDCSVCVKIGTLCGSPPPWPACHSHKSLGSPCPRHPRNAGIRSGGAMDASAWIGDMAGWAMDSRTYGPGAADVVRQALRQVKIGRSRYDYHFGRSRSHRGCGRFSVPGALAAQQPTLAVGIQRWPTPVIPRSKSSHGHRPVGARSADRLWRGPRSSPGGDGRRRVAGACRSVSQ